MYSKRLIRDIKGEIVRELGDKWYIEMKLRNEIIVWDEHHSSHCQVQKCFCLVSLDPVFRRVKLKGGKSEWAFQPVTATKTKW